MSDMPIRIISLTKYGGAHTGIVTGNQEVTSDLGLSGCPSNWSRE